MANSNGIARSEQGTRTRNREDVGFEQFYDIPQSTNTKSAFFRQIENVSVGGNNPLRSGISNKRNLTATIYVDSDVTPSQVQNYLSNLNNPQIVEVIALDWTKLLTESQIQRAENPSVDKEQFLERTRNNLLHMTYVRDENNNQVMGENGEAKTELIKFQGEYIQYRRTFLCEHHPEDEFPWHHVESDLKFASTRVDERESDLEELNERRKDIAAPAEEVAEPETVPMPN